MLIGYTLLKRGEVRSDNALSMGMFFAGMAAISIMLSINFQKKEKE